MSPEHDPIERFLRLQERARANAEPENATAMTLATAGPDGLPTARMVLLKKVDERGFAFYTNYESRKASQLESNPRAALVFHWPSLGAQVRVEGAVGRVSTEESDAYFASRVRQSQLGAWASRQSETLEGGRRELIGRYLKMKAKYLGRDIPRPPAWGGYRLDPTRIEFWIARLGRLHDRIVYERTDDGWTRRLLNP